jgi:hypothetical protein
MRGTRLLAFASTPLHNSWLMYNASHVRQAFTKLLYSDLTGDCHQNADDKVTVIQLDFRSVESVVGYGCMLNPCVGVPSIEPHLAGQM